MIKNLVFDFGKVLVNHDLQPVLDRYFGDSTDDKSRFAEILSDRGFIDDCDRGFIPFDEMIESSAAKWPEFADALLFFRDNYLDEITGEIDGMRELLVRLKEEGFRLYGLTNWSDTIYRVMERYDIFKMLDGYVISCEEHVIKPQREIYLRLCGRYGLEPGECLFTDDRAVNVEGARAAGMAAVVFTTAGQYERDLRRLCHNQAP